MPVAPSAPPPPRRRLILGPGILLAATSIGGSHLLLASRAGAEQGYALLWLVIVAHALKYWAFEAGPRIALATGESLLAAYARVPAPRWAPRARGWALWLGLLDMTVESIGVLAAVVSLCGAILAVALPWLGLKAWALVVLAVILVLLATGGYRYLRGLSLAMMLLLLGATAVAFAAARPAPTGIAGGLLPGLAPEGIALAAALLGWMPTALGVSVWHSVWCLGDRRFWGPEMHPEERVALGLRDARIGYGVSLAIGVAFLCLGAELLHPTRLPEDGPELAEALAGLYTQALGAWMEPVFLAAAFFAMFSTAYASMDGFPVTFLAGLEVLGKRPRAALPQRTRLYWVYLLGVTVGGFALLLALPSPKLLFTLLAGVTFVISPIYAGLNLWCSWRCVPPALRPPRWQAAAALASCVLLTLGAVATIAWVVAGGGASG